MRLIDANALLKEMATFKDDRAITGVSVAVAIARCSTIDPVHAAGAVYCYECSSWEEDAENNEIGRCLQSGDGKHMRDFCSEGI